MVVVGAKSLQLCPTLCDPMDCSPPYGILQARILKWVDKPFSSGSGIESASLKSCIGKWVLHQLHHLASTIVKYKHRNMLQGGKASYLSCDKNLQLDLTLTLELGFLKLHDVKSEDGGGNGDDDDNISNRDLGILHALFITALRERYF